MSAAVQHRSPLLISAHYIYKATDRRTRHDNECKYYFLILNPNVCELERDGVRQFGSADHLMMIHGIESSEKFGKLLNISR